MGTLRTVLASASTMLVLIALPCASAGAAESAVSPLPASDYTVRHVCAAPAPGHAGCLAMRLVPTTAAARAHTHPLGITRNGPIDAGSPADGTDGLRPEDLRDAYFPSEQPEAPASEPQTIALVDAYNDPNAEADMKVYDTEFGLPKLPKCAPGEVSDCFEQVNQNGQTGNPPFPATEAAREAELVVCEDEVGANWETACKEAIEADGWAVEISTDIETAHAVCQNCKILLVEADSAEFPDLETAEKSAVKLAATEISNSWGGEEPPTDSEAFHHPRTVITAAAGDDGYLNWTEAEAAEKNGETYYMGTDYPASSPHVVAVGGTKLVLSGGARQSETVWNEDLGSSEENYGAGGSGCSTHFAAPEWQLKVSDWASVGCGTGGESKRAVADVSADADPYSGVAVYDSVPDLREEEGEVVNTPLYWWPIGGTSVASPIIASMFALAGGAHGVEYPAETLYSHLGTTSLYDVTKGGNGKCDDVYSSTCSGSLSSPFDCGLGALICNAARGYNGPTGVGAPNGIAAFQPLTEEARKQAEEQKAKEKKAEEKRLAEEKLREEERQSEAKKKEEEQKNQAGGSGGSGSTNGGSTTGASGTTESKAGSGGAPVSATPSTSAIVPILSAPALTQTAIVALSHGKPKASQIAFAFTLNVVARVHVKLAKLLVTHGRKHWQTLPYSLTIVAAKGRDSAHLNAHGKLAPGRYRLTLTPAHGTARTLTFQIG